MCQGELESWAPGAEMKRGTGQRAVGSRQKGRGQKRGLSNETVKTKIHEPRVASQEQRGKARARLRLKRVEGIFPLTIWAPAGYKRVELRGESVPVRSRSTFSSSAFLGLWRSWERA